MHTPMPRAAQAADKLMNDEQFRERQGELAKPLFMRLSLDKQMPPKGIWRVGAVTRINDKIIYRITFYSFKYNLIVFFADFLQHEILATVWINIGYRKPFNDSETGINKQILGIFGTDEKSIIGCAEKTV